MPQSYAEKRNAPRIFFEATEKVAAAINGAGDPFSADVLNLSSGGLQFSQERAHAVVIKPGDQLNLVGLAGLAELQDVGNITMEVRWIIDKSFLGVISAGCQFIDLSEDFQQKIEQVVAQRISR